MDDALDIVFEGVDPTQSVTTQVETEYLRLKELHDHITFCRVVLKAPGHKHRHGVPYEVAIHLGLGGGHEINVSHAAKRNPNHEDAHFAIREHFRAARRQLRDVVDKMHGKVKKHHPPSNEDPTTP